MLKTSKDIKDAAFRIIQGSPSLYKAWSEAKTEDERMLMLIEQAYDLGCEHGVEYESQFHSY